MMLEPVQTYPSALLKGRVPGELHAVLMAIRPSTGDHYRRPLPETTYQATGLWPLVVRMLEQFVGTGTALPSEAAADPERARRGTDDGLGMGSRGEGLGGRGRWDSKIKLHLTRDASRRRDRPSREARPSWGTSCFPDRGGAGSVSQRVPSAVRPRYRRRADRVQDGRRHPCARPAREPLLERTGRLHRDDVESARGRHCGGSVRLLRGGV